MGIGIQRLNDAENEVVFLFLAVPAVGADLIAVDANGLEQAVERLVAKRMEAEILTDFLQHALAALGVRVCILLEMLLAFVALQLLNGARHPAA